MFSCKFGSKFITNNYFSKNFLHNYQGCRFFSSGEIDLFHKLPKEVKLVEVGARDGLQNEKKILDTNIKIELIDRLAEAGLKSVEATSFVSAPKIPQMADNFEVMKGIKRKPGVEYPVLTPNVKGYENAMKAVYEVLKENLFKDAKEIAIFLSASETFSKKNINCTIEESIQRYEQVTAQARKDNITIRGYVSCVLGCPYEGKINVESVKKVSKKLLELGCSEISLGDTIGIGSAGETQNLIKGIKEVLPIEQIAVHFHNTYGQALANILVSLQNGISIIDSSISGLGGCPYAKGATGNVATEDVLWMLQGLDISVKGGGVNLDVSKFISDALGREVISNAGRALLAKRP